MTKSADRKAELVQKMNVVSIEAAWEGRLHHTKDAKIINCLSNVALFLENSEVFKGNIRLNDFKKIVEIRNFAGCGKGWVALEDQHASMVMLWMQNIAGMLTVKTNGVSEMLVTVAHKNVHNPIVEYLDGLKWDGVSRIDNYCKDYLNADVSSCPEYFRACGSKWLLSAVARAYEPGCKVDYTLVLENTQGQNKSKACMALVPDVDWFAEGISDIGTKDACQDIVGKWIVELGEMASVNKRDVNKNKKFLSTQSDRYRPSYGRVSKDVKRQCVFVGTVNPDGGYLSDPTGDRRYWPVRTGVVDVDRIKEDRDQLWAEAVQRYQGGERWWMESEELAKVQQDSRKDILNHRWYTDLSSIGYSFSAAGDPLTTFEILNEFDGGHFESCAKVNGKDHKDACEILRHAGGSLKKMPRNGKDRRDRWVFPESMNLEVREVTSDIPDEM